MACDCRLSFCANASGQEKTKQEEEEVGSAFVLVNSLVAICPPFTCVDEITDSEPSLDDDMNLTFTSCCHVMPRVCVEREEEPDEEAAGMKSIASFMVQPKKKARANLFVKRGLEMVDTF